MVGDFGLARSLEGVIYRQKKNICLPFMWMAIESLIERAFSTASDVVSRLRSIWGVYCIYDFHSGLTVLPFGKL